MKTLPDIQTEARQLTVLGQRYGEENRSRVQPEPRVLVRLPGRQIGSGLWADTADSTGYRVERHVEAAIERNKLVYRLVERETELTMSGRTVQESDPVVLLSSSSALEPLRNGYELAEADRLRASLEPFEATDENDRQDDDTVRHTAAQVEAILGTDLLSASDRLRTRVDIAEFLEGRLETRALVARAVERQFTPADLGEHRAERNEFRLTVGEP